MLELYPKHINLCVCVGSTTKYRPQPATVVKLSSGVVTVASLGLGITTALNIYFQCLILGLVNAA